MSLPRPWFFIAFGCLVTVAALRAAVTGPMTQAIVLAPQTGTEREDVEIRRWQARAREGNADAAGFERLGWAFVAKARRTLDAGYYALAEKTAEVMKQRFGASPGEQLLRGHVLNNLHRFAEAEKVARELVRVRGETADYALLSDALMEQGELGAAIEACQQLVNLKPGVEAYSRIAHLRWLKGDLAGATAMMEAAEHAVSPRDAETRAWLLARLSGYYLQAGQTPRALLVAESALNAAASYPPALLARGRALLALGKSSDAAAVLQRAAELNPLPEYQWWLADTLRAAGDNVAADKIELVIRKRGEAADPRTLALFLATRGEAATEAVRLARAELETRADVLTHDALAWALAASGELSPAQTEIDLALAEHTRDARLLWHAGEIALLRGERAAAGKLFSEAQPFAATLTPGERAGLDQRLARAQ